MNGPDALIAGRYRLLDRIGTGGMGVVWKAWDERLQRPVAVKQLHPYRGLSEAEGRVANDRAMREARITARLHHPHAVPVFDVAEHDGQPCLIMQYLPSRSLDEVLKDRERVPPAEVARIGAEVAAALAAAHRVGIVHRDVKPGNVLIAEDGAAKISDFGISHAMGDVTLTATGIVTGTPAYLAPEVARGAASSFASDVFSLGSTLYAALEGAPPFGTQDNAMALLHQVATGSVAPPTHGGPLTPLLMRMLAAAPEDRPAMEEVASQLAAVASGRSPTLADLAPVPGWTPVDGTWVETATGELPPADLPPAAGLPLGTAPLLVGDGPGPLLGGSLGRPHGTSPGWSVSQPPDRARPSRRPRSGLALAGAAVLLGVAVLVAVLVLSRGSSPQPGAQPAPAQVSSPATSTAAGPPPTTPAPSPTATAAPQATTPPPATTPPQATTPPPATTPVANPPTAAQLAQAVTDYYGLLPASTDAGWSRLTPRYQTTTAKNRQTYQAFWNALQRVAVSGTTASPPGTVQSTVTYYFKDGRVVQERTAFGLVADGGVLKIDSSSVLSSQVR